MAVRRRSIIPDSMTLPTNELPLTDVRVVEFAHMVMGPSAGLLLADLGADVIKIEPIGGDATRRLTGSGSGYFAMFSRNKRSICIDLKSPAGRDVAFALIRSADVLIENFRPGAMENLGFGETAATELNPRLIYCSAKGFLKGPYEQRTALDEVAQMMGGLAYMTGPPGRPLRAGSSVIDIMGGLFGALGVLAALHQRERTGRGRAIKSGLYESCVFLVGQHMAQYAVTGQAAKPMPVRLSAWAIYDLFTTADGDQLFIGVVSDGQWRAFCEAFGLHDLLNDEGLARNNDRVAARDRILPRVKDLIGRLTKAEILPRVEAIGLPFAPIRRPEDLFDDPHLVASEGLVAVVLPESDDRHVSLPALPIEIGGERLGARHDPPRPGADTLDVLKESGFEDAQIAHLFEAGVVA